METERVDVAIVGAGFGGLALASFCADAGLSVAILERRPRLAPEGVGLVLQPNGLAVLDRLGLIEGVLAAGQRITRMRQCDPEGRIRARASYADLEHPHPYIVAIERTAAIALLADRLPQQADLRLGQTVTAVEREDGRVSGLRYTDAAGDERVLRAGIVAGADGRNSLVREGLDTKTGWRTGPDRFLIGISPSTPASDAGVLYCGRGWCNGVMPLGDRTYFFDHLIDEHGAAVDRGDFDAWRELYARRIPGGDRIVAPLRSFDDVGFLSGRTHRTTPRAAPGVALVGDAAAAVHPHNGQGANLALEDAQALAGVLTRHGPQADAAVRGYAKERDAKALRQVPWSIFIGRTFDGPHPGWRAMRRWGYLTSRIPLVARSTTKRQAGLA